MHDIAAWFPPPLWGRDREGGLHSSGFKTYPPLHLSPTRGERAKRCAFLTIFVAFSVALICAAPAYAAGDIKAGRQKALACQTCHGIDGLSKIPEAPNIAGSPEQYLARQLNAFRKGERKNEMMSVVAQQLSDKDVDDLAAYYAAIEVTVTLPK
jgi:cytochrome c553